MLNVSCRDTVPKYSFKTLIILVYILTGCSKVFPNSVSLCYHKLYYTKLSLPVLIFLCIRFTSIMPPVLPATPRPFCLDTFCFLPILFYSIYLCHTRPSFALDTFVYIFYFFLHALLCLNRIQSLKNTTVLISAHNINVMYTIYFLEWDWFIFFISFWVHFMKIHNHYNRTICKLVTFISDWRVFRAEFILNISRETYTSTVFICSDNLIFFLFSFFFFC